LAATQQLTDDVLVQRLPHIEHNSPHGFILQLLLARPTEGQPAELRQGLMTRAGAHVCEDDKRSVLVQANKKLARRFRDTSGQVPKPNGKLKGRTSKAGAVLLIA
jgi:hypothetical protein